MLQKIKVKNFQIHNVFELDLEHPITVLAGATGKGKSTLLRALRWLCLNIQPKGVKSYVKKGEDEFETELHIDDHIVVRRRTKSSNEYKLDGQLYKSFGTSKVPDDISKILCVGQLNFSRQLDSPFWFSLSPGEVSKELNSIIRLDVIDSSLTKASSAVKSSKAEVAICKERLKTAREKKKDLMWVEELDADLKEIESLNEEISKLQSRESRANSILENLTNTQIRFENLSQMIVECEMAISAYPYKSMLKLEKAEKLLNELNNVEKRLKDVTEAEGKAQEELDSNKGVECPTCGQELGEEHLVGVNHE